MNIVNVQFETEGYNCSCTVGTYNESVLEFSLQTKLTITRMVIGEK